MWHETDTNSFQRMSAPSAVVACAGYIVIYVFVEPPLVIDIWFRSLDASCSALHLPSRPSLKEK